MSTKQRDCPYCEGSRVMKETTGPTPTGRVICACVDCDGVGTVCVYCGRPDSRCECEVVEYCDTCGLPPWGCKCVEIR